MTKVERNIHKIDATDKTVGRLAGRLSQSHGHQSARRRIDGAMKKIRERRVNAPALSGANGVFMGAAFLKRIGAIVTQLRRAASQ